MAGLAGELVSQTEVTSSPDVFFDIYAHKPYKLVTAAPDVFKSFDLLDSSWGIVGAVVSANYVEDGKTKTAQAILLAADEATRSVTYKVIAGDLLDLYTTISVTIQAGTQAGKNFVTVTMDYLKLLPTTPDPTSLMNLEVAAIKEVDAQNLQENELSRLEQT